MNLYPSRPKDVIDLLGDTFKRYGKVLKAILPLILLAAVVKDVYLYLGGMPKNHIWHIVVVVVIALIEIYLWSAALYSANTILKGEPEKLSAVCKTIYNKSSSIYAGIFALVLVLCLIFFVGYLISNVVILLLAKKAIVRGLSYLIFIGLPAMFALVLFFFTVPLLILEKMNVWPAFRESVRLVWYRYWLHAFIPYAAIVISMLIMSPATKHGAWLLSYHLNFIFDVIILALIAPLIINFTLLSLNDLRLRQKNYS